MKFVYLQINSCLVINGWLENKVSLLEYIAVDVFCWAQVLHSGLEVRFGIEWWLDYIIGD